MPKYNGRDFLLSIENAVTPGTYDIIGGMQSNGFTRTTEAVDVTTKQSAPERALLDCGIRSAEISGSGIMDETAPLARIFGMQFGTVSALANFRVRFGDGDTVTGPYLLNSFERTGEYNQAETFSISLSSAGPQVYVAAV